MAGVLVMPFDSDRVKHSQRVFPDSIELDEWVLFHGTSGTNSDSIETHGICAPDGLGMVDELTRITTIYEQMRWRGENAGGYPALKSFSVGYDSIVATDVTAFLADVSMWALRYATLDLAGGEKLGAVRNAILDLEAYLEDVETRERHQRFLESEVDELKAIGAHRDEIESARYRPVDLDWLRSQLSDIAAVASVAEEAAHRHFAGAVYAIKFDEADLHILRRHNFMGIEARGSINPAKLIAKVEVPRAFVLEVPPRPADEVLRRSERGVLAALQEDR